MSMPCLEAQTHIKEKATVCSWSLQTSSLRGKIENILDFLISDAISHSICCNMNAATGIHVTDDKSLVYENYTLNFAYILWVKK